MYPTTSRTNVTGHIVLADPRPASGLWVLLSTKVAADVYTIKEPTWFVQTTDGGEFTLPGIPPGNYSMYVFAASGSITEQLRKDGIIIAGGIPVTDLGAIQWAPTDGSYTHLWQLGVSDRQGGEFRFGNASRDWDLPTQVPGSTTFTIGTSREGDDWYYAQTAPGTWTIQFALPRTYTGTAHLTVAASLTDSSSPSVTVNGAAITGSVPSGGASTLSRQVIRSGVAAVGRLTFDASRLHSGELSCLIVSMGHRVPVKAMYGVLCRSTLLCTHLHPFVLLLRFPAPCRAKHCRIQARWYGWRERHGVRHSRTGS